MHWRLVLAIIFGLLALAGSAQAVTPVDPSDPNILYTGRWDDSDVSQPWSFWIGSSIIARFEGTGIAAAFQAGNTDYLRIIVDDDAASSIKFPVGSNAATYVLASGLSDTVHKIEIVKETDIGNWVFSGFELDNGKSLAPPPARPSRKIQFYGDSNLAGYSLENEQNNSNGDLRGSYYGLAGIASRMLDAEYQNVSRSGATISNINGVYDRFSYWYPNPSWDFGDFAADVVVVNLGANDVGRPKNVIKNNYHAFLDDLRSAYPNAHIMLYNAWGWDYDEPATYINEVIAERADSAMSYQIFPWIFEQWHGCEYDHGGMAQILADHLTSILGWSQNPTDVMSGYGQNGNVANGSFEMIAPFGGYGWRYHTDPGVSRIHDPVGAYDGEYFLRLSDGAASHQPIPAVDGETFTVTVMMRGAQDGDEVNITLDFRDQEMYTTALQAETQSRILTTEWQSYDMSATAPVGAANPVFHMRVTFAAASGDDVDIDAVTLLTTVGVEPGIAVPNLGIELTAFPNPFSNFTQISYRLPQPGQVQLTVHDVAGRRVATLEEGHRAAGDHVARWKGMSVIGDRVSPGVYFLQLLSRGVTTSHRLILLR